jgi:cobalt-zinc-cadmium efflux system outer membrane protein
MAAAQAAVNAEAASGEGVLLRAESAVALAFYRALASTQREQVATGAEAAARRAVEALERRYQLQDVALLELNVGKGALARATALVRGARADQLAEELELKRLLAVETGERLELSGTLGDHRRYDLASLVERARDRAEVRALVAQTREAEATAAAGRAARWPGLGLGASYERDEGADVVLGVLSVELPFFERGQAERASGQTRAQRLTLESEIARRTGVTAVRGAHAAYQERLGAARTLEQALPLFEQNEELARKSYEAGQLSLADWLVVRREALDTRLEYLDRALAAAEAGVALALAAGVSP